MSDKSKKLIEKIEASIVSLDFKTEDEARKALLAAQEQMEMIQAQLGPGYRPEMTSAEYRDWNTRTKFALAHARTQARQIREWLRAYRQRTADDVMAQNGMTDPLVMLWLLNKIVRRHVAFNGLDEDEQRLIEAIQLYLRNELGSD